MVRRLPVGLYDAPVTDATARAIEALTAQEFAISNPLHGNDAPRLLTRALHDRFFHALESLVADEDGLTKLDKQVALTNEVLDLLATKAPGGGATADDHVHPIHLLAVVARAGTLAANESPLRPEVPLSASDLLVNGRQDLRVGTEVVRELASADEVHLLCSFLKWSGFRLVEDALGAFLRRRPGGLRVLTTAYMGATERRALDALVEMGAQVRVSYDTQRTRLHAKAWLFRRESGFSTACIGSSNLSYAAMLDGLEWNVRLSQVDNDGILRKFGAVFDQYWEDGVFEPYQAEPAQQQRWDDTVRRQVTDANRLLLALHVDPRPHQTEILESLDAERQRGYTKNLVVAATGTGKTVVAALDYKRLRRTLGGGASLLFVAHRREILDQSMALFRVTLGDPVFGERLGGGERPRAGEHVFATVQSLTLDRIAELAPDAYDIVIVDEFHHAAAPTYERLLQRLAPKYLLGLTATPERSDGQSILPWFGGRIAAELRLWKALDQGLLSPFQYFGASDGTDLSAVRWTPKGYDTRQLRNVYTSGDFWVKRVLQEVHRRVADPGKMRALGFCVDIDHADFMADRFSKAGLPSVSVSERTRPDARRGALDALRAGELRAVFSVDLFNEGIDLPSVDTLLFLRPTESATVFLQQLGRGLRRAEDKDCVTVLDFIGGARREFRFDARFRALLGGTRRQILHEVERGFPRLPSGCSIELDRVAQGVILQNIKDALGVGDRALVDDLRGLGRDVDLATFLHEASLGLEDVYTRPGRTWTKLRRRADLPTPETTAGEEQLSNAFARLLHVDDGPRLDAYRALLAHDSAPLGDADDPYQRMLFAALGFTRQPLTAIATMWDLVWSSSAMRAELLQLLGVLGDRFAQTWPLPDRFASIPLRIHGSYGLDEVMAAINERDGKGCIRRLREGVFHSKAHRADLLFVTLDKTEGDYSPTTMYRDYPVSAQRFHWESQSFIHADTETGKRYIEHLARNHAVLLFVRQTREDRPGVTAPYVLLGPCNYVRHEGGKPMEIEWELVRKMPAALYQEIKVAAG